MSPREFLILHGRRPFIPLRVVMSSGQSYVIDHPEMAVVTRDFLEILSGVQNIEADIPKHVAWCGWLHVAHVEPIYPAERTKKPRKKSA